MEFKSSKEILDEQLEYRKERRNYINKIRSTQNIKQVSSSKSQIKYLKNEIKTYDEKVRELSAIIDGFDNQLTKLSAFPSGLLVEFLVKLLSYKENKEFLYTDVVFTQTFNILDSYYMVGAMLNANYLIYESHLKEEIDTLKNTFIVGHLQYSYDQLLKDTQHLMIEINKEQSLLCGRSLNDKLRAYPYLEEIAYNLIDRRLSEPEKDLQVILDEELDLIKSSTRLIKKD